MKLGWSRCLPTISLKQDIHRPAKRLWTGHRNRKNISMISDTTSISRNSATSSTTIQAAHCEGPLQSINKTMASAVCDKEIQMFLKCVDQLRKEYDVPRAWNNDHPNGIELYRYRRAATENIPHHFSGNEDADSRIERDINFLVKVCTEMDSGVVMDSDLPNISSRVQILRDDPKLETSRLHSQSPLQGVRERLQLIIDAISSHQLHVEDEVHESLFSMA